VFLPIGDTPNPPRFTPVVNYLLIGANVLIYLLVTLPLSGRPIDPADPAVIEYLRSLYGHGLSLRQLELVLANLSAYDLFVFEHGFKPGAWQVSDLFASMFLHGGFLHLAGNMLFLWIYGDNVEHRLGRFGYLLTYLATGAVATLSFALFAKDSLVPLVGASGAISGILGLYFLLFRHNRVKVLVLFFPFIFDVFLIPARFVLGFYLVVDNLLPVMAGADSGVAYGAHIGGFIGGLGVAWLGERTGWAWPWRDRMRSQQPHVRVVREEAAPPPPPVDNPLEAMHDAIRRRDGQRALAILPRLYIHDLHQLSVSECVAVAGWLQEGGRDVAATRLMRSCLQRNLSGADLARVNLNLGLLRLDQGQPTAAYQYLLAALDLDPPPEIEQQARAALARINVYQPRRRS
jgi:membrane associated rhomboid family serine protease